MCDCARDVLKALKANDEVWKAHKKGEQLFSRGHFRTIRPSDAVGSDIINGWQSMEFARPSLLIPNTQPNGPLFAFPYDVPPPVLVTELFNQDMDKEIAFRSVRNMLYIPFPGKWWVRYNAITTPLIVTVLDDICGVCAEQLKRPGIIITDTDPDTVSSAAAEMIVPDNPTRDGVVILNTGDVDLWYRLMAPNGGTQDAAVGGPGFPLAPRETAALVGDMAWRGPVNAIADGADGEVYYMQVFS